MSAPDVGSSEPLTAEQVSTRCGPLLDATVARILATGATLSDLEVAMAWAEGQDDEMGEARQPLSGAAAAVYDLITAERDPFEEA